MCNYFFGKSSLGKAACRLSIPILVQSLIVKCCSEMGRVSYDNGTLRDQAIVLKLPRNAWEEPPLQMTAELFSTGRMTHLVDYRSDNPNTLHPAHDIPDTHADRPCLLLWLPPLMPVLVLPQLVTATTTSPPDFGWVAVDCD